MPSIEITKCRTLTEELTPASSPEIIVDEITPDEKPSTPEKEERQKEGEKEKEEEKETPKITKAPASRGPKKNFLARQAALDAKLNVLRIKAEKAEGNQKSVSLEMSDDEVIQHQ